MMEAYSPHRDGESPLHSPHRLRYYDSHPALGEIQRSLSRSPSKISFRSMSPSFGAAQYQPSPLSPSRRATSDFILQGSTTTSPFANRHTSTYRMNRHCIRRTAQTTGALRTRTSPKSPSKRILTDSSSSGNSTPMPIRKRSSTEAGREQCPQAGGYEGNKENASSQEDNGVNRIYTRQEKRRSGSCLMNSVPQSPLKRPEAEPYDGLGDMQSPSAKRRSLHAPGLDFSIFESDSLSGSVCHDRSQDDNDWLRTSSPAHSSRFSTIPKRSSSLRKSTVQQRQSERPPNNKFNQLLDIESAWLASTSKNGKGLRTSLDNHVDPLPRESPFSAQGHLLSASIHPTVAVPHVPRQDPQLPQARHPLSRTLTQSSSTSSFQDDSPTHEPIHRSARPRSYDFSKSLPVTSSRPSPSEDSTEQCSQGSFATPGNYKSAKPLPAAFMSTGLISKKNRNAEEPNAGLPKAHMPDTPCKKQPSVFPLEANFKKSLLGRSTGDSFGAPAALLESNTRFVKPSAFTLARSSSIFGIRANKPSLMRKASFASIESDEKLSHSPSEVVESQPNEHDFPPTPTKQNEVLDRKTSSSPSPLHDHMFSGPRFGSSQTSQIASITHQIEKSASPQTPLDTYFPPDPSRLSISGRERPNTRHGATTAVPATPTGPRESFPSFSNRPSLNVNDSLEIDTSLSLRFDSADVVGTGEFSQVYRVQVPSEASPFRKIYSVSTTNVMPKSSTSVSEERVFAVKKSRCSYSGPRDRQRKLQEVEILKALRHADHVVSFVDSWEHDSHLYIQTEFCEEGTLDVFLADVGQRARLDDFRIWKILLELSSGLHSIHTAGYIHLDMKPANVLITFDGVLKIADFGMATRWPAKAGIEGEGDREYIGPEVLLGKYDKPADIFALGLIMLEIAGNVELPDNGISWQKLRSGDMSDVPSLTWSSGVSSILRDASGNPLDETEDNGSPVDQNMAGTGVDEENRSTRNGELFEPPSFMTDGANPQALDSLVKWMISPEPLQRPIASDILHAEGVRFVESRRRAGATVFEGNWGPADEVLAEDAEMIDV